MCHHTNHSWSTKIERADCNASRRRNAFMCLQYFFHLKKLAALESIITAENTTASNSPFPRKTTKHFTATFQMYSRWTLTVQRYILRNVSLKSPWQCYVYIICSQLVGGHPRWVRGQFQEDPGQSESIFSSLLYYLIMTASYCRETVQQW